MAKAITAPTAARLAGDCCVDPMRLFMIVSSLGFEPATSDERPRRLARN
jgi:hypothetical protein